MKRKTEHIELTEASQVDNNLRDTRFNYEPLIHQHPENFDHSLKFLGKTMNYPIWISSMTGGVSDVQIINERLARICNKYKLGMGLGSIRKLLEDKNSLPTFNLRPIIGTESPFIANIGVAQVEEIIKENDISKLEDTLGQLDVDGLMIHINPLQEWIQIEGDKYLRPPCETVFTLCDKINLPVGIKEVGQGMGPKSIKKLLSMPIQIFEFGAFGGTNFSKMELLRRNDNSYLDAISPICSVGHDAISMVNSLGKLLSTTCEEIYLKEVIISGGIPSWMDGMYLIDTLNRKAKKRDMSIVFGQASKFLKYALISDEELDQYIRGMTEGLNLYKTFLDLDDKKFLKGI